MPVDGAVRRNTGWIALALVGVVATGWGCGRQPKGIVAVELMIIDLKESQRKKQDSSYVERVLYAGPAVVPQLAQAVSSPKVLHRAMGRECLELMTHGLKWPEAYRFVLKRLRRKPPSSEAGALLASVAHRGIAKYPKILPHAAAYLNDNTYVYTSISNVHGKQKMRVCDFAAVVVQNVAGVDFGASSSLRSDAAVAKARAWVEKRN